MPRKKGSKNSDTDLKARQVLEKKLIDPNKTQEEIAEELNVSAWTVGQRLKKALELPEIKEIEKTSEDRITKMLPDCDLAYLDALRNKEQWNARNRLHAATMIYKTRGLIKENPEIVIENQNILEVISLDGAVEKLPV